MHTEFYRNNHSFSYLTHALSKLKLSNFELIVFFIVLISYSLIQQSTEKIPSVHVNFGL